MHPLTDAFIKGRAKFKKVQGKYFETKGKRVVGACHLGAAYWGVTGTTEIPKVGPLLKETYPEVYNNLVPLPCNDLSEGKGDIPTILIHLNDEHDGRSGWSDKEVANWLESVLGS